MKIDSYQDQVVMITGAASGFGELLARRLAGMGARLALGDRNAAGLARVVAEVCDVSREAEVKALVDAAVDSFERLDIGINNAGILTPMKSFIDTGEDELDLSFAVNTKGVFFGMKHQIRQMLAQDRKSTR